MAPLTLFAAPFTLPSPPKSPIPNPNPNTTTKPSSLRGARRFRCRCRRSGGSSWDPNAESVPTGRFRFGGEGEREDEEDDRYFSKGPKRRWWSDEQSEDDDFNPFDDGDDDLESPWDAIWIFKVFRSYGYLLPAIIASTLLATGPKAFLMALALPLGQSVLSLAIDKVWGKSRERPRKKTNTKRKPFSRSSSPNFRNEGREESSSGYKGGQGYQSWVSADTDAAGKETNSLRSGFGGWDDLDRQRGSMKRQVPSDGGSSQADSEKRGKLSKKGKYRDVPLLLRLLVAVFPFLGSWTRLL